jgi:hypothetical protein
MSVVINVIGANPESDEYKSALIIQKVLSKEFKDLEFVTGNIVLHANANIVGQAVKDIDILMIGKLTNYTVNVDYTNENKEIDNGSVTVRSFCTAIEVKSHGRDGVYREGTEIYARYSTGDKSVTTQSNEQKNSIFNFFKRTFSGSSPYVSNLIFFNSITQSELKELMKIGDGTMPPNIFGSDFSPQEFFQVLAYQSNVYKPHNRETYYIDSLSSMWSVEQIDGVLESLTAAKHCCGKLTRRRIEQLTTKSVQGSVDNVQLDKMTICRGRAGTGKTVALIRKAIKLVDEDGARVLILTYNNALVADIKRLFALADLPDMFQPACVDINTMQSFFFRLINKSLYDDSLSGEDYLKRYDSLIKELAQFLEDDSTKNELLAMLKKDSYLHWDYCFVDEAQDWTNDERDVLLSLFGNKLLIADGGQQFVRSVESCDWNIVDDRTSIKLKKSLRQENNLITFINDYAKKIDDNAPKILPNDVLLGGRVIIQEGDIETVISRIKKEIVSLKKCDNTEYDMLVFVPSDYVDKQSRSFIYKTKFMKSDINIWDGTNDDIRSNYSVSSDDIRVLQYESGRGLEGWSVVCLELDTFLMNKIRQYKDVKDDSLMLESEEDRQKKYLLNWLLLPLTRSIDNLIITFKDKNSPFAKAAYEIASRHPDYINIMED